MTFGHGSGRPHGFAVVAASARCPCGSGETFGRCCAPLHAGAPAPTAERLMRSRYSAFVVGEERYLRETWHGSTRPARLDLDPSMRWLGLEIVEAVEQGDRATVEFVARYRAGRHTSGQRERSRFLRRGGRWFYLDAAA